MVMHRHDKEWSSTMSSAHTTHLLRSKMTQPSSNVSLPLAGHRELDAFAVPQPSILRALIRYTLAWSMVQWKWKGPRRDPCMQSRLCQSGVLPVHSQAQWMDSTLSTKFTITSRFGRERDREENASGAVFVKATLQPCQSPLALHMWVLLLGTPRLSSQG